MAIDKINRVVLSKDVKDDLDNKATKSDLQNLKTELENQINDVYSNIVRKPTVATFDDIRKTYTNAKDGWTVTVGDTNITYQYDLETDSWFPTSINALALATNDNHGLMRREDYSKLQTVLPNAEPNLTPQQALEQIKTVDGVGSGLDADLLQGKKPSDFASYEHNHDGRYATKTELNIIATGKSDKSHTHTNYTHNQLAPSKTWIITHNMNKKPSVVVVDSADEVVYGDIRYISENEVNVLFSAEFSGKAYLN